MWQINKGWYVRGGSLPADDAALLQGLRTAPYKDDVVTLVPATIINYRLLLQLGMPCPSPIDDPAWQFVGAFKPMSHQRKTVTSILSHHRSFVLDDPGTGKTHSAIWAIQALFERSDTQRVLIVAPLSIIDGVWRDALFFHTDWAVADLTRKTRDQRMALAQDLRYRVLLVNPQTLHSITNCLPDVHVVIVDECTNFKAHSSRQTKALDTIVKDYNPMLVMMTGTPAPQGPADAYRLIKFVNPRALRLTYRAWRDMTEVRVTEFKWLPRSDADKTLSEWLQPGTRTSREQALDLPPLRTYVRRYTLTEPQIKAVKQMREEAYAETDNGGISAANAAVAASKALQILTGEVRSEDREGNANLVKIDASTWYEAVAEIVDERHEPVLIFVPFRAAAARLGAHLKCPVVSGTTPSEERRSIYRQINDKKIKACVAVAQTMSHGLTLTGANCVLWALPPVGAEQYHQANARVYRNGQSNPVDIIHLVGHNFVQALFTRTDERVKLQQAVLDALAEI